MMTQQRTPRSLSSMAPVIAAIAALAGCSKTQGVTMSDFQAAIDGQNNEASWTALRNIVATPADMASVWFYFSNAVWPADVTTVLADPHLQSLMAYSTVAAST